MGKGFLNRLSFLLFTFFLSLIISTTAFAGTVQLPETGQTKCYDLAGVEITCSGTGQDGEIRAGVNKNAIMKKVSALQILFMENQGQIKDESVKFYANTFAGTVFVTDKGEIVYSLIRTESKAEDAGYKMQDAGSNEDNSQLQTQDSITKAVALRESLVYSNQRPDDRACLPDRQAQNTDKIKGLNKSETKVNYFVGGKDNWRSNIQTWQEVSLGEVYKGVELELKAYGKNVEKIFTVNPKGSVEDIKLKLKGAKSIRINENGELEVETELGVVKYTKPVAYQEINGKRVEIDARYKIQDAGLTEENNSELLTHNSELIYGFKVGNYDSTRPLVIDPLLASTFIGGSGGDQPTSVITLNGNVYIAGYTESPDFPVEPGYYDNTHNGNFDVFISKFDSGLQNLLASTFIGGSDIDYAGYIAADSSGNIYIAGITLSSDYPTTADAYDKIHHGGEEVFISKLDGGLQSLLASTFIGTNLNEAAQHIALDTADNVYIAGYTYSSSYPVSADAYDKTHNGGKDAFVSKFDSDLKSLLASTLIGGSSNDEAYITTTDSSGDVYVTGYTYSSGFPTSAVAYDKTYNFNADVFISKFDSELKTLLASTFLGGSNNDYAYSMVLDNVGNVFIAGYTSSPNFPVSAYADDKTHNGNNDVFISKLDSSLQSLIASTFAGGSMNDGAYSVTIDNSGNLYITGYTWSSNFPTGLNAYDRSHNGTYDGFILKIDADLSATIVTLAEALDNLSLTWTTGGDAGWYGQTEVSYYGGNAARSGELFNSNETSWIQTMVTGTGIVSFYWSISNYWNTSGYISYGNLMDFYVDGVKISDLYNWKLDDWKKEYFVVSAGNHQLRWIFEPFSQYSAFTAAVLDKVVFTKGPVILILSPDSLETEKQRTYMKIRWLSTEDVGENVRIELLKNGLFDRIISSSTPNNGAYNWIIPSDQMTGAGYQIKITSTSNPSLFYYSDTYFTIEESQPPSFGWFFIPEGPVNYFTEAMDHPELNIGNESGGNFTIEAWYYEQRDVESMEGYPSSRYIIGKPGSFYINSYHTIVNNTDMDCIGYEITCNDGYSLPGYKCESSSYSTPDIWHHVALIADSDKIRFYIDGKLGSSWDTSGCFPMNNTNESLIVGEWMKVDEVRISDVARYSGSSFIPPIVPFTCDGNTRALWHFDEPNDATEFHDVCGVDNTLYKGGITGLLGDMNKDGVIDISDVILVLRIALKIDPVQPCSDINNDGIVDISDVILTLRMALKIDPLQQCS